MATTGTQSQRTAIPSSRLRIIPAVLLALLWAILSFSAASAGEPKILRTVEGRVLTVDRVAGTDTVTLVATIELDEGGTFPLEFAPTSVCEEIGFVIEEGDRLRARVFVEEGTRGKVQNVRNFSRETMVRLRTMHRMPLWSSSGVWVGGEMRTGAGPHRIRARGGSESGGPP